MARLYIARIPGYKDRLASLQSLEMVENAIYFSKYHK